MNYAHGILYGKQRYATSYARERNRQIPNTSRDAATLSHRLCYTCGYAHARHYCPLTICRTCGEHGHSESMHNRRDRRRNDVQAIDDDQSESSTLPPPHPPPHRYFQYRPQSYPEEKNNGVIALDGTAGRLNSHPNNKSISFLFAEGSLLAELQSKPKCNASHLVHP